MSRWNVRRLYLSIASRLCRSIHWILLVAVSEFATRPYAVLDDGSGDNTDGGTRDTTVVGCVVVARDQQSRGGGGGGDSGNGRRLVWLNFQCQLLRQLGLYRGAKTKRTTFS